MNEEQRDRLYDLLPVSTMTVWTDDEELEHLPYDVKYWADVLGHPRTARDGKACATCGNGMTCVQAAYEEALITSVIRELDKIGALNNPDTVAVPREALDRLVTVAKWVSRGKSAAFVPDEEIAAVYPDATARFALGSLHDEGILHGE